MQERDVSVHITTGTVIKTILLVLLVYVLWFLRDIVLVVLTAIVIASAIEPAIRFFVRRGLPRLLGVIIMYALVIGVFFGILFFSVPPILNDAASFLKQLPQTLSSINVAQATGGWLPWNFSSVFSSADILQSISATITSSTGGVFSTVSAFFGGLVSFILIVVFSFYLSVQETGVDDFLRIVTPTDNQAYVLHL